MVCPTPAAMLNLYIETLDKKRQEVFQDLVKFSGDYTLGGGTALALLLNHRRSFDFDLFSAGEINPLQLQRLVSFFGKENIEVIVDTADELSVTLNREIKISYIYFPFPPLHPLVETSSVSLFSLDDLASNKAYVLGRRPAYRDYVDLYFLLKDKMVILEDLIQETLKRFGGAFSEKLFLEQLTYQADLKDFAIDFIGPSISGESVQKYFDEIVRKYLAKRLPESDKGITR